MESGVVFPRGVYNVDERVKRLCTRACDDGRTDHPNIRIPLRPTPAQ
jgi:hypothetical protein